MSQWIAMYIRIIPAVYPELLLLVPPFSFGRPLQKSPHAAAQAVARIHEFDGTGLDRVLPSMHSPFFVLSCAGHQPHFTVLTCGGEYVKARTPLSQSLVLPESCIEESWTMRHLAI